MSRFVWDEAKYPTMSPLKEVVENIQSQVAKIEDDLKVLTLLNLYAEWFRWCNSLRNTSVFVKSSLVV